MILIVIETKRRLVMHQREIYVDITTARIKYIFCKVNELFSTEDIRDFDQRVYKCPGRSDTFRYFIEILSLLVERLK